MSVKITIDNNGEPIGVFTLHEKVAAAMLRGESISGYFRYDPEMKDFPAGIFESLEEKP